MFLQVSNSLSKILFLLFENLRALRHQQFAQVLELLVNVLYRVFVLLAGLADLFLHLAYNLVKLLNRLVSLL